MKDRIKNEVTAFLKSFPFGKVPDANQLAEHFYNLALEDVKKEVEKLIGVLKKMHKQNTLSEAELTTLELIIETICALKK